MKWRALLLGQALALLCSATGISGSLLVRFGISAPLFQLFWFYLALLSIFSTVTIVAFRRGKVTFSRRKSLLAAASSLLDTQGNFLLIYSFSFTTVTSVSVLTQSSFIYAAMLSFIVGRKRYTLWEYFGLAVTFCGLVIIVLVDLNHQHWKWTGDAIGDVMALAGAFLFSLASVFQEFQIRRGLQEFEYLAHISLCAVPIMALEGWLLESAEILHIHTLPQVGAVALFAVCYCLFYSGMPFYLKQYGATAFNMSLIPNIIYILIFAAAAYKEELDWLYIAGLCVVLAGLVAYNLSFEIHRRIVRTPPLIDSRSASFVSAIQ